MNSKIELIQLPKFLDPRGNLSVIEGGEHIPFDIKRTYLIYDVPGGQVQGGHAYKKLNEFIVALSGSFDVILDNGKEKSSYQLNRSYYGIYIPNMVWRSFENFSTNALCMIVASERYDPDDYIRDYNLFISLANI